MLLAFTRPPQPIVSKKPQSIIGRSLGTSTWCGPLLPGQTTRWLDCDVVLYPQKSSTQLFPFVVCALLFPLVSVAFVIANV